MKILFMGVFMSCLLAMAQTAPAESVMHALETIGEAANEANDAFLNSLGGKNSYESQMAAYRRREAARVRELAEASGVDQSVIRNLRQNGKTWEQIAAMYNVNLDNLPSLQAD